MKKLLFILLIGTFLITPSLLLVSAQGGGMPEEILKDMGDVERLLESMVRWMWMVAGFVVIIFFLYAGFLFVTAGGNDEQVNKAKGVVKWALVGVVVMLLATSVMQVMQSFVKGG